MSKRIAVIFVSVFAALAAIIPTVGGAQESGAVERVVDNSDGDRFAASESWKTGRSGEGVNGEDYRFAPPAEEAAHALFKVEIPEDGEYTVYVRWPRVEGLNGSVPVGVETAYGTKWKKVNQRENGGRWVRVGEFEMRADEEFPVRISRDTDGRGRVVADAVRVVQVQSYQSVPSDGAAPQDGATTESAEQQRAASASGADVVRKASTYKGTRYRYATCTRERMSCTCLVKKTFAKFGYDLPMTEEGQARYGKAVSSKSELRPGDLVYFRENGGSDITHNGIYAGNGYLWHASSYFGKVVRSEMKYIRGYAGARRLV